MTPISGSTHGESESGPVPAGLLLISSGGAPRPALLRALARDGLSIAIDDELDTNFAVRVEAAVYKIVEEALTNVMRHAAARSVTISLEHAAGTLTISEGRR